MRNLGKVSMKRLALATLGMTLGSQLAWSAPRPYPVDSSVRPFGAHYDWVAFYDYLDGINGVYEAESELLERVHLVPNQIIPRLNPVSAEYELRSRKIFDESGAVEKLVLDFVLKSDLSLLALNEIKSSFPLARLYNANPRSSNLSIKEFDDINVVTLQNENILLNRGHGEPIRIEIGKKGLQSLSCAYQIGREVVQEEMSRGQDVSTLDPLTLMMGGVDFSYRLMVPNENGFVVDAEEEFMDKTIHVRIRLSPDDESMAMTPFYNLLMEKVLNAHPDCHLNPSQPMEDQIEVAGKEEFSGLAQKAIRLGIVLFNIDFRNLRL